MQTPQHDFTHAQTPTQKRFMMDSTCHLMSRFNSKMTSTVMTLMMQVGRVQT